MKKLILYMKKNRFWNGGGVDLFPVFLKNRFFLKYPANNPVWKASNVWLNISLLTAATRPVIFELLLLRALSTINLLCFVSALVIMKLMIVRIICIVSFLLCFFVERCIW